MSVGSGFTLFKTITHITILVLGTIGNVLVILVVSRRRKMRTVTNYFILNLAVADLTVLISSIPIDMPLYYSKRQWVYGRAGCKIIKPLQTMGTTASILTLVIISLSRYHAIVYPFRRQMKTRHARVIIVVIWIISFGSITPYSLAQKYIEEASECKEDFESIGMTPMMYTITIFLLQYVLPMIGMTYAYNRIGAELNRQQNNDVGLLMNPEYKRESRKVVKMLSIVVAVFAVLVLPLHVVWLWHDCFNGAAQKHVFPYINDLALIMLYGNSVTNPIIYSVCNDKFRKGFKELFGSCISCCSTKFRRKERANSARQHHYESPANNDITAANGIGMQVNLNKNAETVTLMRHCERTGNILKVTAV